jgi:DNA-directed RNA polymerase specialized sigma24 family protein
LKEQREPEGIPLEASMAGIVALLAIEREERLSGKAIEAKTEVVLATAGLSIAQIARILGKNYQAVQKVIYRARDKGKGDQPAESA